MKRKLYWKTISSGDRHEVIDFVKSSILSSEAYIAHFDTFSDLDLSLNVVIEERQITRFHKTLSSRLNLSELDESIINHSSTKEWQLFINISFTKGKGIVTKQIPEVPG